VECQGEFEPHREVLLQSGILSLGAVFSRVRKEKRSLGAKSEE
jgi:hypothetical protein